MSLNSYDVVSNHTSMPVATFVHIWVADHLLRSEYHGSRKGSSRAPEYIQSIQVDRITDSSTGSTSGTATLSFFDKNWNELEAVLNLGWKHVSLQYGYYNGIISEKLNLSLLNYTLKFNNTGVFITAQATIDPSTSSLQLMTLDTGTNNPTEAIKKICESLGYQIGTFEATQDLSENIAIQNTLPMHYINTTLAPKLVSTSGSAAKFYIDYTTTPPTANLISVSSLVSRNVSRNYVYGHGINSSVISLDIDVKNVFGGYAGTVTKAIGSTIDTVTGEESTTSVESTTAVATNATNTQYTNTDSTQTAIVDTSGLDASDADKVIKTMRIDQVPYEGTMTILGDPTLSLFDEIQLTVIKEDGEEYTSVSGKYTITGLSDTISGGRYTTTLSIAKYSSEQGTTEMTDSTTANSGATSTTSSTTQSETTTDYSVNSTISKARVRILVPTNSAVGHYELHIPGEFVFKNQKFSDSVFSYSSDSTLAVCPLSKDDARYSGQSYTAYYIEFDCSGKFESFIRSLESVVSTGTQHSSGYMKYKCTGEYANYNISTRNCFTTLASWCKSLGYSKLSEIVSSSKSYKDY